MRKIALNVGFALGLLAAWLLAPGQVEAQIVPAGGCNASLQCRAASFTTTGTVSATGTGAGFTSAAASGTNGFANTAIGARIDFGPGSADYGWSDGGVITFANPVNTVGALSSTAGVSGTTGAFSGAITSSVANGSNAYVMGQGARIDLGGGIYIHYQTNISEIMVMNSGGTIFYGLNLGTGVFRTAGQINVGAGIKYPRKALQTCAAAVEGVVEVDVLSGSTTTSKRTKLCLCTSDGAASPAYAWVNLATNTTGNTTTCGSE